MMAVKITENVLFHLLQPGDRIEFIDWRSPGRWVGATVVAVEHPHHRTGDWIEYTYPFDPRHHQGQLDGPRLSVLADFYADDPKYLWPWRRREPDQIRASGRSPL